MISLRFVGALTAVAFLSLTVSAQTDLSAFTGLWSLDRARTNVNHDFPDKLKDFRMLISTNEDKQLVVRSQVIGNVDPRANDRGNALGGDISTQGSRTNTASVNGVMASGGTSAAQSSSSSPLRASYGGTLAIYFTPGQIAYDLTGKEIKIEPPPEDKVNGTTRIRAKFGKDGKSVELTVIRKMKGQRGEAEITTRETWRISDDGKTLQFHRTVQTPTGEDEISMTMSKQA